jgi:hypothetical protein
MKAAGFAVNVHEVDDATATRKRLGLSDQHGSCRTAVVAGCVVEDHVPAQDVKCQPATRPKAVGIAVPGMLVGSPGMEQGSRKDAYQVFLVDKAGTATVFASYPKR